MNDDQAFLAMLPRVAEQSGDLKTKVGAIIARNGHIVTTACNDFPQKVADTIPRRLKPIKMLFTEHAERNAIFSAARHGHACDGCVMYTSWFPCADCARAIIQAGIVRLVCREPDFDDRSWGGSFEAALAMLTEAGIDIKYYSGD